MANKAFVIGNPVAQSLSPRLHSLWLDQYKIAGSYRAIEVARDKADIFLRSFASRGFCGGNITIPYKELALNACHHLSELAQRLKAVNTVWLENGLIYGGNSDVYGFTANLDHGAPGWSAGRGGAMVFGAGGAARSVVYSLAKKGFSPIYIANRTRAKADRLIGDLEISGVAIAPRQISDYTNGIMIVVNTLPAHLFATDRFIPEYLSELSVKTIINDINYSLVGTPLISAAKKLKLPTVDGIGMLIHQAIPGFRRWFGVVPEINDQLRLKLLSQQAN